MIRQVKALGRTIEYELVQTDRHDLSLKVTRDETRLFAPRNARLKSCDDFVRSQADWVEKTRAALVDFNQKYISEHPYENGSKIMYEGNLVTLDVAQSKETMVMQSDGAIAIRCPETDRESVKGILKAYMVDKARIAIENSLRKYAPIVGKYPNAVRLREQKTRWGSCSSDGNLNFNWKLIMTPKQSLDYVVVHELCHLYELNHSSMFWRRVKSVMPDYEYWKKWLKDNAESLR